MKQALMIVAAVLMLTSGVGCSGGNLTTREKGAGIGALGAPRRAESSVPPWAIRGPERRLAARLVSVLALLLATKCRDRKLSKRISRNRWTPTKPR